MLAYQNPVFQTEIDKPIADLKKAVLVVFNAKSTRYIKPLKNDVLNTFSCNVTSFITLIELKIQLQKMTESKTLFRIEAQSPLGGGLKERLQRVMDEFIKDFTDAIIGKLVVPKKILLSQEDLKKLKKKKLKVGIILWAIIIVAIILFIRFSH
jgi:hypothetical protein